jgi:hypothetical protein
MDARESVETPPQSTSGFVGCKQPFADRNTTARDRPGHSGRDLEHTDRYGDSSTASAFVSCKRHLSPRCYSNIDVTIPINITILYDCMPHSRRRYGVFYLQTIRFLMPSREKFGPSEIIPVISRKSFERMITGPCLIDDSSPRKFVGIAGVHWDDIVSHTMSCHDVSIPVVCDVQTIKWVGRTISSVWKRTTAHARSKRSKRPSR